MATPDRAPSFSAERRALLAALVGALGAPLAAAQPTANPPRLCFPTFDPGTRQSTRWVPFFQGLRDLGYVDGQSLAVDYLSADGQVGRLPALADECVRLGADVIVVTTTPFAHAAKKATRTVPIVMLTIGDPVGTGLVESLGRPGGNVTGTTTMAAGLSAKRLELLKAAVPRASRVLVLAYVVDPIASAQIEELKKSAASLGLQLQVGGINSVDELPAAFAAGARDRAEALLVTSGSFFFVHRARVVELAVRHRLSAMYSNREIVDAGGLMVYDADRTGLEIAGHLCPTDPEGCQARRSAGAATHGVRARHQPQDRARPPAGDPAVAPAAGGPGHRVTDHTGSVRRG